MPFLTKTIVNRTSCNMTWERFQKRVEERRSVLENARSMNVKRLQQDIEKISKREMEFAKKLFEEIVPVRITVNEDALDKLQSIIPIRVEHVTKDAPSTAVEIAADEKKDNGP